MNKAQTKHIEVPKPKADKPKYKWNPKGNLSLYRLPFKVWVMKSVVKLDSQGREIPGEFEKRLARGETDREKLNHRLYKAIQSNILRQFLVNGWRLVIGGPITYEVVNEIIKKTNQMPATMRILQFYDDKTEEFLSVEQMKQKLTKMEDKNEK
jgi:hypothetical protein